jgi:hypothetical protein
MSRSPGCRASNAPSKVERLGRDRCVVSGAFTGSRENVNFAGRKKLHFGNIPLCIDTAVFGPIASWTSDSANTVHADRCAVGPIGRLVERKLRRKAHMSRQAYFRAGF